MRSEECERFREGVSDADAVELLKRDVRSAESAVLRLFTVPLTDGQFDALVSFIFNLGAGALQRSTLRRVVNRGAHGEVADQLGRWIIAGGKKRAGLVRRRRTEAIRYAA